MIWLLLLTVTVAFAILLTLWRSAASDKEYMHSGWERCSQHFDDAKQQLAAAHNDHVQALIERDCWKAEADKQRSIAADWHERVIALEQQLADTKKTIDCLPQIVELLRCRPRQA